MALPRTLAALACGLLFGLGLAISGMMNPAKVIGFLDVAGAWDPTLAFVMGGALLVAMLVGMALHAWISGERKIRMSSSPEAGDAAADPR